MRLQTHWADTWAAALHRDDVLSYLPDHPCLPKDRVFHDCTIRQQLRVGVGSSLLRLRVSNEFSSSILSISRINVAVPRAWRDEDGNDTVVGSPSIQPDSAMPVLFSGKPTVDIPAGATIVSDPISFNVLRDGHITVSMYLEHGQEGEIIAGHEQAKATSWLVKGDHTACQDLSIVPGRMPVERWYYLTGVEGAHVNDDIRGLACFGDSITDRGNRAWGMNKYNGWTDFLSQRLQKRSSTSDITVLNLGISGDQVWKGGLARFERDVICRSKVKYVFVLMGTNDISFHPDTKSAQTEVYERVVAAYNQIITKAHTCGISTFASTILPRQSEENNTGIGTAVEQYREETRLKINDWIRYQAGFDYVVDWAKELHETDYPQVLNHRYRFNDYTHPNEAGCRAMADAIDLDAFSAD